MIERDELDRAETVLEEAGVASGALPQNALFSLPLFIRGHLRFERGEFAAAADDFLALSQQSESLGFGPGPTLMGSAFRVRALVVTGRVDEARELAESSLSYAHQWGTPGTIGHVLRGSPQRGVRVRKSGFLKRRPPRLRGLRCGRNMLTPSLTSAGPCAAATGAPRHGSRCGRA
jgi:hypothetical protein